MAGKESTGIAFHDRVVQGCQRLPLLRRTHPQQQDIHGAFTAAAEAPERIVGSTHVVTDARRDAAVDHAERVLAQIALEATTGQEPRIAAVTCNEHPRTMLAVGGSGGAQNERERKGFTCRSRVGVERQEAVQFVVHGCRIMLGFRGFCPPSREFT